MSKPLECGKIEIDVMKEVALGDNIYQPGKGLVAQATDLNRQRRLSGPTNGVADTLVDSDQILRCSSGGHVIHRSKIITERSGVSAGSRTGPHSYGVLRWHCDFRFKGSLSHQLLIS